MRGLKQAIVLFSILLLAVGLSPIALAAGPGGGQGTDAYPTINPVINFPAYPNVGGPYIVAATSRPSGLATNGAGATGAPDVFLVFNEPVAGVVTADFIAYGFTFSGVAVSGNTVRLTGVANQAAGDQVRLASIGCITDTDGNPNSDVARVTLTSGPVITGVFFANEADTTVLDDAVTVVFDADVDFGSGGDTEDNAFGSTVEFNGAVLDSDEPSDDSPSITITYNATPGTHPLKLNPGVSTLVMAANRVRWEDNAAENSTEQRFVSSNEGPAAVGAYWDGTSLWIVMSDAVDLSNEANPFFSNLFDTDDDGGGNWGSLGTGDVQLAAAGEVTTVLKVVNIDTGTEGVPDGTGDAIRNRNCGGPTPGFSCPVDYQGLPNGDEIAVLVHVGVGIIRASYDDLQTSARTDDRLYVWLSEPVDLTDIDDDFSDFQTLGFNNTGLSISDKRVESGLTRLTVTGFTTTNYPKAGSRLQAVQTDGSVISGDNSGGDIDDVTRVLIWDESRPYSLAINENADQTYDRWDDVNLVDSVFVAWNEANATDGDNYFLFMTKLPPSQITATWMRTYLSSAIPLGDGKPQATNANIVRHGIIIEPGVTMSTDGEVLVEGDQIYVLVAAIDNTGNVSQRGDLENAPTANHLFGAFLVGPLCPPRDFITDCSVPAEADSADWDHDVIHIVGDSTATGITHFIYGDIGSIPCDADSVVIFDGPDETTDNRIGSGIVNVDGSFGFIELEETDPDLVNVVYVFSKTDTDFSAGTPIIFQREYATVSADPSSGYPTFVFDPWNPYRIYNRSDYVNVRLLAARNVNGDVVTVCANPAGQDNEDARSSILHIWADFTQLDLTAGNISGFGTPADSINLTSLGADLVDNDGDWQNSRDLNDDGTIDAGELFDDVGLDGIAGTNDQGEGDGAMTFGDPYTDENGNGQFDPGETFVDRVNDTDRGDHLFDPGETNLDSNDSDEFGWYEVASTTANTRGTVRQGYQLNNPDATAMLDPYTPVVLWIEDNGVEGGGAPIPGRTNYPASRQLPYNDVVTDYNRTLYHVRELNGGDAERRFVAVLDLREPTHSEVSYLSNETGLGTDLGPNIIVPGNPVYNLGRYVNIGSSMLSDNDVLYLHTRARFGTSTSAPSGAWRSLVLDPWSGTGHPTSDANSDGFPGSEGYDEDSDSTSADIGGFDEDEDGIVDAADPGEGIDLSDREVHAADQDSVSDAAATYSNGLNCQNDYTDNDNDAFFVYDSYANGGLSSAENVGKFYWYNVDESQTNNFDDDNDGQTDESDEAPESSAYNPANDDNEDGIADGQAIPVSIGGGVPRGGVGQVAGLQLKDGRVISAPPAGPVASILAIQWDPFGLGLYAAPTPGPGVDGGVIMVDAAHILGKRKIDGSDPNPNAPHGKFYANELAYGEPVGILFFSNAYENLISAWRTAGLGGYTPSAATDSVTINGVTDVARWNDLHLSGDNIDWELLQKIYGFTADGATIHQIRFNAYDKAGNVKELWSEPISFTLDLDFPIAEVLGCGSDLGDFADVSPAAGTQVYDAGKHPDPYTVTATADDDAASVTFEWSFDEDFDTIEGTEIDNTAPFTFEWPTPAGMYTINNYPAANADTVYFRALASDEFNNTTPVDSACVVNVVVIDGTEPHSPIVQIDDDDNLEDGACVAPDSSIAILAHLFDNDEDANGNPLDWVAGLDTFTGDRNIDDDGDGNTDEDDVDGDALFTLGIDDAGVDNIPGTTDDEWNGSNDFGNFGETDDYITNDIVKVVFEYNPVDDSPDAGWLPIETVHGDPYTDPPQVIDWTEPVAATWNTLNLPTGNYDVRAWACDIEGNCDSTTAFITSVCIRTEPLRAYILPEVCTDQAEFDLYAVHYIHDYEIDKVRFEYYADTNGDQCANDGGNWIEISTDDAASGRGDAVLYRPDYMGGDDPSAFENIEYFSSLFESNYTFWDPENDGYSSRDPIFFDAGNTYEPGDEVVIGDAGQVPFGATLKGFAEDEFWAEEDGNEELDPNDWILRENNLTGTNGTLEKWTAAWDATGLPEGNYLTRAIAIDQFNQEDVISYTCYNPAEQNPEEIELVRIDSVLPTADITTLTLPDGTEIDVSGSPATPPYVPGSNAWMKVCATGDADIARMLFEYSLDGGANWNTLDVNNDDDFFADINDTLGTYDVGDELFNDLNGNYEYDGPSVDFVRYDGGDGVVDTPLGWPLIPLTGEDVINGEDDDYDGQVDEDPLSGTPPDEPGSPEDYTAPFCIYVDIKHLPLWTDVNVLFRATAYDQVCDIYRPDPTPDVLAVILGENMAPEADIVRVEDLNGDEVDTRPATHDGDGCDTIGGDVDTIRVFVTAEDLAAIDHVDLFYRLDPSCYPDLSIGDNPWKSMTDEGWTAIDSDYPYDFNVATDNIPDGSYQFFPRAYDENGNATPAPLAPWCFKKFALAGVDFAYVSLPAPPPAPSDHAAVGDEYVIEAQLTDPSTAPTTAVRFYYAERVLDESIDASQVQPNAPYESAALNHVVVSQDGTTYNGVVLTINGTVGTPHSDITSVPGATKFDYEIAGDRVIFGARPDGSDEILISYNISSYVQIGTGDDWSPYSVAWDNDDGGVPEPGNSDTDAYDLIAIALFDVNGDGSYDGNDGCDYDEPLASEGNYLILDDQERPLVKLYGLDWSDDNPDHQGDYPDLNWPGNPLFNSGDNLNQHDYETVLSGVESDVFVLTEDQGGGVVDSVSLAITSEILADGATPSTRTYAMTLYDDSQTTIDIPITMYEEDYPEVNPANLENVILHFGYILSRGPSESTVEMTDHGDYWQATARLPIDAATSYYFSFDLVGDHDFSSVDRRNFTNEIKGRPELEQQAAGFPAVSLVIVPDTPFWYHHFDNITDLANNAVHTAVVTAFDNAGNSGNNLNSGQPGDPNDHQGEIKFIHDRTDPVVQALRITNTEGQPWPYTRVSPQETYWIWADISDAPFTDLNILGMRNVLWQFSPNSGQAWVDIGDDGDPDLGPWNTNWVPTNGEFDGYDNDGDGLWDEEDERVSDVTIRAIATDEGMNSTYSEQQVPAVTLELTVDAAEPTGVIDTPRNGQVFAYNEDITLTGSAQGDYVPSLGGNDIAWARFQARLGGDNGNLYYVDDTYNGVGHAGYYDNGIDEIWQDSNGDGGAERGNPDTNLFPGQDGIAEGQDGGPANVWFDIDPTPIDNSDFPRLNAPNNGASYQVVWSPLGWQAAWYGNAEPEWIIDEYVRLRLLTKDVAGNEDTEEDGFGPPTTLILLNDTTTPRAYITMINDKVIDPVETLAIAGDDDETVQGVVGPNAFQVAAVKVWVVVNGTAQLIANVEDGYLGEFTVSWDASALSEGTYQLYVTTVDDDGNESDPATATRVNVRIDRTPPVADYDSYPDGFVSSISYMDDGVANHSSLVVHPDTDTKDVIFVATTLDADVEHVELQWRNAADPDGLWRPIDELLSGGYTPFDYEPNLNFPEGNGTQHVWRLHVEDFASQLITDGPMQFRALMTDEAGNTNALQTTVMDLTTDGHLPTLFDWNDDSVTNQVEVGSTTNFEITTQDLDYTDVVLVWLEERNLTDGGDWTLAGVDTAPDAVDLDSDNTMWRSDFAWTAPSFVVHDTNYAFRVRVWDSAWNTAILNHPNKFELTVEDNAAPDRTKIVDVEKYVAFGDDFDGDSDDDDDRAGREDHDSLYNTGEVWADADGDGFYDAGTELLISEGSVPGLDNDGAEGSVGDDCATYPRNVDEGYLNDAALRNEVRVARTVTVVGRTQADDDGIDSGIAWVSFWAQPLGANDQPVGDPILIGKDEVAPFFPLYYWHTDWDTQELTHEGTSKYPDGRYRLGASGVDQEGNVEDTTSLDWTAAIFVVDNTPTMAQMDADATTSAVDRTVTVQRNSVFTLFARTLEPGTSTVINDEDDVVTFWYKRSRDLNMADSWGQFDSYWGQDSEDLNPDETRPYSMDVNLGQVIDPTDPATDLPLAVGENYDFVATAQDPNCNDLGVIGTYADSTVAGVLGRHIKVHIVDTIAPCLEITRVEVERLNGEDINYVTPTKLHAQVIEHLEAKLLTGDRDLDHVEFVYRKKGETTWNLIDADLVGQSEDGVTWSVNDWDLRTLDHNSWYEVAAVGVDNVGNVCQTPDIVEVYVDFDAPPFAMIQPSQQSSTWCTTSYANGTRDINLIVRVDRGVNNEHDDVDDVIWEVKASDADSTQWVEVSSGEDTYNDGTNTYSQAVDLEDDLPINGWCETHSILYDMRVRVRDLAGNESVRYSWKNTVDLNDPDYVQVTRIHQQDGDDVVLDPHDLDQFTEITAGSRVAIYGTASDDEECIPNEADPATGRIYETGIALMQFQVTRDLPTDAPDGDANDGEVWRDLGTVLLDPPTLGDLSAQSDSVLWNTTGLAEGQYLIRVGAKDECQNPLGSLAWSAPANVRILDRTPPIARIQCWDPDLQPHGDNPPTTVTIYALAESDPDLEYVQFQYNVREEGETSPVGEWVNIGISTKHTDEGSFLTEEVWSAQIVPNQLPANVTRLWLRALVEDTDGNRYGDNPEDVVPTIAVQVVRTETGMVTFEAERAAAQQGGSQVVERVGVEIRTQDGFIANVTVKMANAEETPRVVVYYENNEANSYPSPESIENISPGVDPEDGGMVRSINDPTLWYGWFFLDGDFGGHTCHHYDICVTGLDNTSGIAQWIDEESAAIREWDVTYGGGTNGVVETPAYDGLGSTIQVIPGAIEDEDCLVVSPTYAPVASHDQDMHLHPVLDTAYFISLLDDQEPFGSGYEPVVTIKYSDAQAAAALEGLDGVTEANLTVRRWNPFYNGSNSGAWVGSGISHIHVDPVNNVVSFRVDDLACACVLGNDSARGDGEFSEGNIFQLFAPTGAGPVTYASFWPSSPYVNDWWTDADPQAYAYLKETGGQVIDLESIELLIDGEYWATWFFGYDGAAARGGQDDQIQASWTRGATQAYVSYVNSDLTVMSLSYSHSYIPRDWLSDGEHRMTIRYKAIGTEGWTEGSTVFHVDQKPPYVEFDGGWVQNPRLKNVAGYMNPENNTLQVKLYDGGAGVLFKEWRGGYWCAEDLDADGVIDVNERYDIVPCQEVIDTDVEHVILDLGIKYDVWLVDGEDDQADIDEIEERVLLHQGTASELEPWITPRLENYVPATDTLHVPVPVVGGGAIGDNDIVEIAWYSDKSIEQYNDGPGFGCSIDTLVVDGQTFQVYGLDCTYDAASQEHHIYNLGVLDWAGNASSKYVEQRFIVDMTAPSCNVLSPGATVDPAGNLDITIDFADGGAGLDPSSIHVTVTDPEGNEVEIEDVTVTDNGFTGYVEGPLKRGEYVITIHAEDKLGNACNSSKIVKVETAVLGMTGAHAYPNPFDPAAEPAKISFDISRASDVTVKVYDFGGQYVATLAADQHLGSGSHAIEWGGEASDGTDLANGTYIVRVTATDGTKTEEANLKVVLWRE